MLSGFNTNFRYRGVLFHVQTEDSGLENPHVISHLFHGGNIMASEKRDYSDLKAEHSGVPLEDAIRKLMEGQHKSMLKKLSRGEHDSVIAQRMGPDVFRVEESPTDRAEPPTVTEEERPPMPTSSVPPEMPPEMQSNPGAQPIAEAEFVEDGQPVAGAPPVTGAPRQHRIATESPPSLVEPTILEPLSPDPEQTRPGSRLSKVFGERVVSEKPLDEVVLDYLVENARKRKRSTK